MTTREYLGQLGGLRGRIRRLEEQMLELRSLAERVTACAGQEGGGGRSRGSKVESAVLRLWEVERELGEELCRYIILYREIRAAIEGTRDPVSRELLALRYIQGLTWEEVSDRLGYARYHVTQRLHPKALLQMAEGGCLGKGKRMIDNG